MGRPLSSYPKPISPKQTLKTDPQISLLNLAPEGLIILTKAASTNNSTNGNERGFDKGTHTRFSSNPKYTPPRRHILKNKSTLLTQIQL